MAASSGQDGIRTAASVEMVPAAEADAEQDDIRSRLLAFGAPPGAISRVLERAIFAKGRELEKPPEEEEPSRRLNVWRGMTGQVLVAVDCKPKTTARQVKHEIYLKTGIPIEQQQLFSFGSSNLIEDDMLVDSVPELEGCGGLQIIVDSPDECSVAVRAGLSASWVDCEEEEVEAQLYEKEVSSHGTELLDSNSNNGSRGLGKEEPRRRHHGVGGGSEKRLPRGGGSSGGGGGGGGKAQGKGGDRSSDARGHGSSHNLGTQGQGPCQGGGQHAVAAGEAAVAAEATWAWHPQHWQHAAGGWMATEAASSWAFAEAGSGGGGGRTAKASAGTAAASHGDAGRGGRKSGTGAKGRCGGVSGSHAHWEAYAGPGGGKMQCHFTLHRKLQDVEFDVLTRTKHRTKNIWLATGVSLRLHGPGSGQQEHEEELILSVSAKRSDCGHAMFGEAVNLAKDLIRSLNEQYRRFCAKTNRDVPEALSVRWEQGYRKGSHKVRSATE